MSICPNNNKVFDGFLFDSGLINKNSTPVQKAYERRRVYYTICVMLRLAIAGLLLQLKDKFWVPYVVAVASLYSAISLLFFRKQDSQWWSNKFQATMSVLLFVASLLCIFKINGFPTYSLALLFFISIFGGVFQSLLNPSC